MSQPRKIPTLMFSQHPDNASKPYWHTQEYIDTHDEIKECLLMYQDLKAQEIMWDWEGKLVDESIVERLLTEHPDFFQKQQLGRDLFLTFRVPNPRIESSYKLARAFMVILATHDLIKNSCFSCAPLFEVILPMTENAQEIIGLQDNFYQFAQTVRQSFGANGFTQKPLEIIPLFESVDTLLNSRDIIDEYIAHYQKQWQAKPAYLRPFCARSDPALNSGIVPTTLAIKWALSEYAKFADKTQIKTYPILAPGALPFRGGLSPATAHDFINEFAGIRTLVIQSAFRYDYTQVEVKQAIDTLLQELPQLETQLLPDKALTEIKEIIPWFETPYKKTVETLAPVIQQVAQYIPKRRERVQHIGLFGYPREVGKNKLPRAIGFTACGYSLGIPPEFYGVGQGLKTAQQQGKLKIVESYYQTLKPMLLRAGRYLRKETLDELGLDQLKKEIEWVESYLGEELKPMTDDELKHQELAAEIVALIKQNKSPVSQIEQAAAFRRSIG